MFEEVWLMYNEEAHCTLGRALSGRACVMLKFSCPALKKHTFYSIIGDREREKGNL